jgi:hypothetical protein
LREAESLSKREHGIIHRDIFHAVIVHA